MKETKKATAVKKPRPPMDKSKKQRIIILSVAVALLVSFSLTFAWLVLWRAPDVDDVYDRVVELIESSQELNTVFYGAGIATYSQARANAEFDYRYEGFEYRGSHEILSDYARFTSDQEIRDLAERVYSKNFLETMVYPQAFVGYAVEDGIGGAVVTPGRFLDDGTALYVSVKSENWLKNGTRVYDFSTMRVTAPSNQRACYVEIDSYLPETPDLIETARLRLVKQDDGQWYLDSLSC